MQLNDSMEGKFHNKRCGVLAVGVGRNDRVGNVEEQEASRLFTQPMKKCGFSQLREVHLKIRWNRFHGDGNTQMALERMNVLHVILKQVFGIERREDII